MMKLFSLNKLFLAQLLVLLLHPQYSFAFQHPGCPLTLTDLATLKSNLNNAPWSSGYAALQGDSHASLGYTMQGPFGTVSRSPDVNLWPWRNDMIAIWDLSRMWYFTGNTNYAQKAHDILLAWANTQTTFGGGESMLDLGDYAYRFVGGADILRGTWPGWTAADTATVKAYFGNVLLPATNPYGESMYGAANKGALALVGGGLLAIFDDDTNKLDTIVYQVRTLAHIGLRSSDDIGLIGDSLRDQGHAYGQLFSLAMLAEALWKQGIDIYSDYDNRLLTDGEYFARVNSLVSTPFLPFGTTDQYYIGDYTTHGWGGGNSGLNLIHGAYVVRKGLQAPYTDLRLQSLPVDADSFMFIKQADASTATPAAALSFPTTTSITSGFTDVDIGDASPVGASSYSGGTWTVQGGGSEMWLANDSCHFSYVAITGDCAIIAKVTSVQNTSQSAKAGVMMRTSLSQGSPRAWMAVTPRIQFEQNIQGLAVYGGDNYACKAYNIPSPSYWVKLERVGNIITGYVSQDGANWAATDVGRFNGTPPATLYVGLMVCSMINGTLNTSAFSNVQITGGNGGAPVVTPAAPAALLASPGAQAVPLRWEPSFGATSYNVLRSSTSGGPYTTIATGVTKANFVETNLPSNTTYYYVVTASNSAGTSGYSPPDSATTQPVPPAPTGLIALPGNARATLLWASTSGTTSYNVKRSTTSGSGYVTVTNVAGTSFVDTGMTNGTTCYYVVSAVNGDGEGANSSEAGVTPNAGAATALFWTGAVDGNWDTATANWVNNGGSVAYQNGNAVVFDDSVLSNTMINLAATLLPSVVVFNNASKSYSINGNSIGGTCGITLLGSGSVALNGTHTFTGGVTVEQGTLMASGSSALGSGVVTLKGGALQTVVGSALSSTIANRINVSDEGGTLALSGGAGNLYLNGPISGSGNLIVAPPGGILNSIYLNFSANTVSGTITIPNSSGNNQTVTRIGAATAGSPYAAWVIGGAQDRFTTLDFGTGTIAFGSLFGDGTICGNSTGVHTLSVGALNQDSTFSGNIIDRTGTMALTKVGSGTLALTGVNTYTGANNINAGRLLITTASQAKGNYTVASGATFSVTNATTGSASISNLTLAAGSTIELMNINSTTTPLLTVNNVMVNGSCTVKISLSGGIALGTYPLANYAGSFSGNFANLQLQLPAGISGTLVNNANQIALSITVIPVPAALTSLDATSEGTQIELDWSASDYATGYNIWRSLTSGSDYTLVGGTADTNFIDSGLAINQTYYYVVAATNSFGSSAYSPEASATTQPALKWTGAASVNWDTTTTNWSVNGSSSAYQDGASVWFDDTALSNTAINVSATVSPAITVVSNSSKSYSFSGNDISGSGGLLKLGNGTLTFNVANTYSGGTMLSNGTLIVNNNTALGSGTATLAGGTFRNGAGVTIANNIAVTGSNNVQAVNGNNWTWNGNITGNGIMHQTVNGSTAQIGLGGDNSGFTGTWIQDAGNTSLRFDSVNAGSASAAWVFNQSQNSQRVRFNFGTGMINLGSISGGSGNVGMANISSGAVVATLSVGALNTSTTYSGGIEANGANGIIALTKVGTGTLTLTGANTYTGLTTVSNGALVITTASLAKGVYLVTSNATFGVTNTTTGSATISNLIVAAGSALEFQRVTNTVTPLIATSNLTVNGSCIVKIVSTNGLKIDVNYPLISYAGTFSGKFTNLLLQMPSGYGGILMSNANLVTLSVTNLPAAPANLAATAGDGRVMLAWNAVTGATGYNVKSSLTSGGAYMVIGTNLPALAFTNTGLVNGTVNYYVVSTLNAGGESTNPPPVNARPVSLLPVYLGFGFGNNQLQLNWPADHTGWRLEMNTNLVGSIWLDMPAAISTNQISLPVSATNNSVFFRLVHP